jgi:predicted metal-dependent phosphoesterase TrpH
MDENSIYADLHMHTPNSDGTVTLDKLPEIAQENNLRAVAITDHDRTHPKLSEPIQVINGVDVISGIELRVKPDSLDERVDLLGYGVEPTNELNNILKDIRQNRIERSQKIIDLIEDETGVRLDMNISDNTGRPHIARAIEDAPELDYTYGEAFDELIGNDCVAYKSRDIPSFEESIGALRESCHFISLAHPFRYDNPQAALQISKELDGVEVNYDYGDMLIESPSLAQDAVDRFDLTMTGGSDAHDIESIGSAGLTKKDYKELLSVSGLEEYK